MEITDPRACHEYDNEQDLDHFKHNARALFHEGRELMGQDRTS